MPETIRWYLEVAFLVLVFFALGAALMAVALRVLLPEPEPEPEPEADGGPTYSVGAS